MPVNNADIAAIFNEVARLLEIEDANQFRVRAYRNAARTVSGLSTDVADMIDAGQDLSDLPDIGDDLAGKIATIVQHGSLPLLEGLRERLPEGLLDMLRVPGLGPRKVASLYKELGIQGLQELEQAAESGKIRGLSGFGPRTERNIRDELARMKHGEQGRMLLAQAEEFAEPLREHLRGVEGVRKVTIAGSYRRRKGTVGDLDILVACADGTAVMDAFTGHDDVRKVVSKGETRSTVILRSGLQVDLRVVPEKSYGAALHYFTGSRAHNIAVRKIGLSLGYKVNEYGVFQNEEQVVGRTEEEVYEIVGLHYVEPELRENRGEIGVAKQGGLPRLVQLQDLRGDLHVHSRETDGRDSLKELAAAGTEMGYAYLAVTDHSRSVAVANGMDQERLRKHVEAIDAVNEDNEGCILLKGVEVDILKDGSLDLPDDVLQLLDIRVCALHSHFRLPREEQTSRLLKAMDNPLCNVLAHPSGRKINEREPCDLDMERIMQGAAERGCFLEINSQPERLDLEDVHIQHAKGLGVHLAVSTDAHWSRQLENIRFGVDQARRGWLEPDDVVNTRDLGQLRKLLRR